MSHVQLSVQRMQTTCHAGRLLTPRRDGKLDYTSLEEHMVERSCVGWPAHISRQRVAGVITERIFLSAVFRHYFFISLCNRPWMLRLVNVLWNTQNVKGKLHYCLKLLTCHGGLYKLWYQCSSSVWSLSRV